MPINRRICFLCFSYDYLWNRIFKMEMQYGLSESPSWVSGNYAIVLMPFLLASGLFPEHPTWSFRNPNYFFCNFAGEIDWTFIGTYWEAYRICWAILKMRSFLKLIKIEQLLGKTILLDNTENDDHMNCFLKLKKQS